MEARWCREARARGTAFSESKWGPESPQLESETGSDTGIEQNGLEGSGPSVLCIALRNSSRFWTSVILRWEVAGGV